jgi:hypothetical protein
MKVPFDRRFQALLPSSFARTVASNREAGPAATLSRAGARINSPLVYSPKVEAGTLIDENLGD